MSPAKIEDAEGRMVEIVNDDSKLPVTRADGQQGIITSLPPDGFSFSGSILRNFKSGRPRKPVLFRHIFGPKCKFKQLDLIDGKKAIAINDKKAETLRERMGR